MPGQYESYGAGPKVQGILVDFSGVILEAREAMACALTEALTDKTDGVNHGFLCRHLSYVCPNAAAESVASELGLRVTAREQIRKALVSAAAGALTRGAEGFRPGSIDFLKHAAKTGCSVAVCGSDPSAMTACLAQARLDSLEVQVVPWAMDNEKAFTEAWSNAARALQITAGNCLAIVASAPVGYGAMVAGFRYIGVPDRWTAYHDYGGADAVFDAPGDIDLSRVQGIASA